MLRTHEFSKALKTELLIKRLLRTSSKHFANVIIISRVIVHWKSALSVPLAFGIGRLDFAHFSERVKIKRVDKYCSGNICWAHSEVLLLQSLQLQAPNLLVALTLNSWPITNVFSTAEPRVPKEFQFHYLNLGHNWVHSLMAQGSKMP